MIIGIAGKKRAGKDTLARAFIKRGFRRIAFADPIRRAVEDIIGEEITDANKEVVLPWLGVSPRTMMQTMGTEWGRSLNEHMWLLSLLRKLQPERSYVIPDIRFENEAHAIRERGGIIIHVERQSLETDAHVSEAGIRHKLGDTLMPNNYLSIIQYELACERAAEHLTN